MSIKKNQFQRFKNAVGSDVDRINKDAAHVQAVLQRQLCPVSDKEHVHLVETIKEEQRGESVFAVTEGDEEHEYWLQLEYGTEDMLSQPHIRPAHEEAVKYRNGELAKLRQKYT